MGQRWIVVAVPEGLLLDAQAALDEGQGPGMAPLKRSQVVQVGLRLALDLRAGRLVRTDVEAVQDVRDRV